jgi:ArsR family transcriptional regulator
MAKSEIERLAALHKALSDETRIRVVNLLGELGELCVCDIEAGLEITQSKASRHLAVLKQVGLVADRRDGTWVYYGLRDDLGETGDVLVAAVRLTLGGSAAARRDVSRTRKVRRSC